MLATLVSASQGCGTADLAAASLIFQKWGMSGAFAGREVCGGCTEGGYVKR